MQSYLISVCKGGPLNVTAIILTRTPISNQYNLPTFIVINEPLIPYLIFLTFSLSVFCELIPNSI